MAREAQCLSKLTTFSGRGFFPGRLPVTLLPWIRLIAPSCLKPWPKLSSAAIPSQVGVRFNVKEERLSADWQHWQMATSCSSAQPPHHCALVV